VRSISSRQNPIVRTFRELAAHPPVDGSRLLLDGVHLVEEARAAGLTIECAAVSSRHLDDGSEIGRLADALARDTSNVLAVTEPVMSAVSPVRSPSGIVAIASRKPSRVEEICGH
jgi:tRNA G18 (ribose-2'-O)-methylase SpoU